MATQQIDWRTGRALTPEMQEEYASRTGVLVSPEAGHGVELYPFQTKAVQRVLEVTVGQHQRAFLQLATGSGKTVVMAELARLILSNLDLTRDPKTGLADEGIIFMCHRRELVNQAERTFKAYGLPVHMSYNQPANAVATRQYKPGHINIQTAQKLASKRRPKVPFPAFLFVDEGHHAPAASWNKVLRNWNGHVLLVSATPYRVNEREHFLNVADVMIRGSELGASLAQLIDDGYLREPIVQVPNRLLKYLNTDVMAGDVSMGRMTKRKGMDVALTEIPVEEYLNRATWRGTGYHPMKALMFAATQEIAVKQVKLLQDSGVRAGALLSDEEIGLEHGLMPYDVDREFVREGFEIGELDVIVNCGIVSEGYDVPAVDCVIIGRPTLSLPLYKQMIGRSMRPHNLPDGTPKNKSLIIDCGGSLFNDAVGHPLHEPMWSLYPRITEQTTQPPIMKRCAGCGSMNWSATQNCTYCTAPFGKVCEHCNIWRPWKDYQPRGSDICVKSRNELREQEIEAREIAGKKHFLIGELDMSLPYVRGDYLGRQPTRNEQFKQTMRKARLNSMVHSLSVVGGKRVDSNLIANQRLQTHAGKVLRNVFCPHPDYWQARQKAGFRYNNNYEDPIMDADIKAHSVDVVVVGISSERNGTTAYVCDYLRGNDAVCEACGCIHDLMVAGVSCVIDDRQRQEAGALGSMLDSVKVAIADGGLTQYGLGLSIPVYDKRYGKIRTYRGNAAFHPLGCLQTISNPSLFDTSPYRVNGYVGKEEPTKLEAVQVGFEMDFGFDTE